MDRKKGFAWSVADDDLLAPGRFVLHIEGAYWSRSTWADGKKQKVEECVNEFVEGLIAPALIDKQHRPKRSGAKELGRSGGTSARGGETDQAAG